MIEKSEKKLEENLKKLVTEQFLNSEEKLIKSFVYDGFDEKVNNEWKKISNKSNGAIFPIPTRYREGYSTSSVGSSINIKYSLKSYTANRPIKVAIKRLLDIDGTNQNINLLTDIDNNNTIFKNIIESIKLELDKKLEFQNIKLGFEVTNDNSSADIVIALARMKDFNDSRLYDLLSEQFVSSDETNTKTYNFIPVITIGLMSIMSYYNEDSYVEGKKYKDTARNVYKLLNLDKRFRFFDSSIWFQYVPLTNDFKQDFKFALGTCAYNIYNRIYPTLGAYQSLEFNLRLLKNSYVHPIKEGKYAPPITPFIFHSESRMRILAKRELAAIQKVEFKIAILDDLVKENLSTISLDNCRIKKGELIENLLKEIHIPNEEYIGDNSKSSCQLKYQIKSFKEIPTTIISISKKEDENTENPIVAHSYDLIMLNYAFDELSDEIKNLEEVDYGFKFIEEIKNLDENKKDNIKDYVGHNGRFFILPISTFPDTMQRKLRDLGISNIARYWEISEGVDPITTPELFRYRTFYILRRILMDYAKIDLNEKSIYKKVEELLSIENKKGLNIFHTPFWEKYKNEKEPRSNLLDIVKTITEKQEKNLHYEAIRQFPNVVRLGVKFKQLYKSRNSSPFAKEVIRLYFFDFDSYAWDHLQHFIYLLSFGTFQQKEEMWEEYVQLSQIIGGNTGTPKTTRDSMKECLDKIGIYIANLGKK